MTFADTVLFFYLALSVAVFTCQLIYFATMGVRQHLKERKLGADMAAKDESWIRQQS